MYDIHTVPILYYLLASRCMAVDREFAFNILFRNFRCI